MIQRKVTIPDSFYSTTARLGAIAPFQALSDGKYIYIFRQSVAAEDDNNIANNMTTDNPGDPIVNKYPVGRSLYPEWYGVKIEPRSSLPTQPS